MKNINYFLENSIEKLLSGEPTEFLMPNELSSMLYKIKKVDYKIYKPYRDADKVILYTLKEPDVVLFQIECTNNLRHQDILGALFNQGITNNSFGDIIVFKNNYYFYALKKVARQLQTDLTKIGKHNIIIKEIDKDYLSTYEKPYETYTAVVPSLRLDAVLSSVIKASRKEIDEIINDKKVLVNYEVVMKKTYIFKENDIFSVQKHGKYKFITTKNITKKDKLVIEYIKYI